MKKNIDVSIIIVNYNTKALLETCLRSLDTSPIRPSHWEVIVVDNASTDHSREMITQQFGKRVTLIGLDKNLGYAAGNNRGIRRANGRYILLLNSDTEVEEGSIDAMVALMDAHPQAGGATCRVLLPNGDLDPACHRGFPTPWAAFTYFIGLERVFARSHLFGQYHLGFKDMHSVHEIDSPVGAFFIVRRETIADVGMLDEDYFMYGEDIDWAYRMKQKGWKIFYNPAVWVLHRKKQSGRSHSDPHLRRETRKHFYNTMALFYKKHYKDRYGFLTTRLVLFGVWLLSKFYFL